jgi:hypothetical protein
VVTSVAQAGISLAENALKNAPDGHPPSPSDSPISEINKSSIGDLFNIDYPSLFNIDPNNIALTIVLYILILGFCSIILLFFLTLNLIYIYIYSKNLEFK